MPQEPDTPQFDVFLSHNSVDKPWVAQLKADLQRYGLSAWLDQDEIRPGNLIVTDLEAALDNSRAVALIVSPEAMASGWVKEEYARAVDLAQDKQRQLQLIPVILRGAKLPGFLRNRNWVDFRDGATYAQSVWKLVWGITGRKPTEVLDLSAPDLLHAAPARPSGPVLTPQLKLYLETMIRFYRNLPLGPLDPGGREKARVTLEQVYVSLDAQPPLAMTWQGQAGEARSALAHVAHQPRLVILGDPGSGKSTFLRFLALRLTQACLEPAGDWLAYLSWPIYSIDKRRQVIQLEDADKPLGDEPWPYPPLVPVFVTLRDFAATQFNPTSPLALWEFIVTDLTRRGLTETAAALQAALVAGEGILLLDGVDEVPPERRAQVWQAIGALAGGVFNRCPWLATCRVLSYVEAEAEMAGASGRITLAPLNKTQIETFIQAWYQALVGIGEKTPAQGDSLAGQLSRVATGRLRELAQNPMLLTIMALVQSYYGTLPEERAKLYQACVETLLLRWQQSKEMAAAGLPVSLAELGLKQEALERLLWEIGWVAHQEQADRRGAADIAETQVMALAKKHLGDYVRAEAFVEYTERRAHLLIGVGGSDNRRFSFPHRTFQEYLAGCYLANERRFGRKAIPLAEAGAPWREVLLLAAGTLVYNQKVARNLFDALEDILPRDQPAPGDTPGWQRVWRAGEMLALAGVAEAEADEVGQELLPRARDYLAALLAGGELTPVERAEAGQALAILGDPRPGVGIKDGLPDIVWCEVEAGPFIMGSDEGNDDEKPAHPVTLPAFQISQYPITNMQFSLFIDAGGYATERYWVEAKEAGYWQIDKFKGRFDDEVRDRPYDFGPLFNLPNHPVVGVSWYEAIAFCRWLSEQLGCLIRLPTEEEWEKAARGVDGRTYPWGDEAEAASRCNMADTGIGTTNAVGIFPSGASPYGVLDMSGNIWEWCSTVLGDYIYLDRTNVIRVLHGGTFYSGANYVRCAARSRFNPNKRYWYYGFRVVMALK